MAGQENIRALALDTLIEINENGGYSHIVLRDVLDKYTYLDKRDRAFLTRLVEGTLERMLLLDAILDACSKIPVAKMKPFIRNLLRMSAYQIRYMDAVPDAAACDEAVKLAKRRGFAQLAGFVNGVLRGFIRTHTAYRLPDKQKEPLRYLSLRYCVPEWIVGEWLDHYGYARTKQILAAMTREKRSVNEVDLPEADTSTEKVKMQIADSGKDIDSIDKNEQQKQQQQQQVVHQNVKFLHDITIRTNLTKCTPDELATRLTEEGVRVIGHPALPYAFMISGIDHPQALASFREGWFYIQDVCSMLAVELANPQPGDYVIDVCAAPGGKSLHVAQKLQGTGRVEARDLTDAKLQLIEENIVREGLTNIYTVRQDALVYDEASVGKADLLLCDLPCSGLGVLGQKKDIRYKMTQEQARELARLQRQILDTCAPYVCAGGVLLYSTCTIHRAENEDNVEWFLANHHDFRLDAQRQILPGEVSAEGFFMARFVKNIG